jgi:hypothetical protein
VPHVVAAEQTYDYRRASRVRFAELGADMLLSTSGGLAVAADSAARLGARDAVQGLDAISAAPRSSRLIVEARRLGAVLTS